MTTTYSFVLGLDVAKDKLDIALYDPQADSYGLEHTLPNSPDGHQRLMTLLARYRDVLIVLEATGTYHLRLVHYLHQRGQPCAVINPLSLRRFAQMKLRRAKTDRVDARLLAEYGYRHQPALYAPESAIQQQLKHLQACLRQLIKQRTALGNLCHAMSYRPNGLPECEAVLTAQLTQLDSAIDTLESKQQQLVKQAYPEAYQLLRGIPGIGPRTAVALLDV